jgi:polysaccharide export outer membrane protein
MAVKDLHNCFDRLKVYHWAPSGIVVVMLLGNAVTAIAATADVFSEEAIAKRSPAKRLTANALVHDSSTESEAVNLVRPVTANDATEPDASAPLPASTVPETRPSSAAERDEDVLPAITPNPENTAPLPLADPSLAPLPFNPQPALTPDPFFNSVFGNPSEPDFDTYRLGPGDAFFVNVRQFPELSFQATLDIQGNVVVPLHGVVSLNGLTLQATETLITQLYNQYVVNPDVSLTLVAQRGVEVTILGEVVRPGYYPLGAPQIAAALLSAGGTTGSADLRDVLIQRRLPDGQVLERRVDLFTPLKEGQEIPDVALQDGDVILVDRLDPAELDEYDRNLVARSTLAKPTITVRFLNYGSGNLGGATSGALTALDLPNGSRFADALVRANLNPDTSNLGEVALIRFDEEAGRAVSSTLDGNDAFQGIPSENPPLQDNDVIIVNRTVLAKITYALNTFTQPFRDVLGFLLFFDQLADSADSLFGP